MPFKPGSHYYNYCVKLLNKTNIVINNYYTSYLFHHTPSIWYEIIQNLTDLVSDLNVHGKLLYFCVKYGGNSWENLN